MPSSRACSTPTASSTSSRDPAAAEHFLRERFARRDSVVFVAPAATGGLHGFTQLYPSLSSVSLARIFVLNDLFVDATAQRLYEAIGYERDTRFLRYHWRVA